MKRMCLLIFSLCFAAFSASGQDPFLTVPDLTRLSIPEAASTLRHAGLRLGQETIIAIDPASGDTENIIVEQSPRAGEAVEAGAAVSISVTRAINAYVLYDDNDLTLVNVTAGLLDLNTIRFSGTGETTTEFNPSAWAAQLDGGRCGQIWSVARLASKEVTGCSAILWMTAGNRNQHFWTHTSGAAQFSIIQDGVVRATCPAAQAGSQDSPLRCEIVFDVDYPDENIDYIYIAYTTDRLIIHNQTVDRWMSLDETHLRDSSGRDIELSSLNILNEATGQPRLAPGECILFAAQANAQPPEPCQVIGQVETDAIYWLEPFSVIGRDDVPRVCEAAEEGALVICVMLR
jgi:hypothetical protein